MDATGRDLPTIRRPVKSLRIAMAAIAIAPFLLSVYFASVGPAFVITVKSKWLLSNRIVRKTYRPLFDVAPEFTCYYLRQCGVSDIEAFFVMQAPKGETR